MNYYLAVLKKYTVFNGRAQRAEYWYFTLFSIIIAIVLGIISAIIGDDAGILNILYVLAVLIPSLAVSVRRLHDIGKSGWMLLISLIPLIGTIWLLVLMVTDSNPEENKYGPNPKGTTTPEGKNINQNQPERINMNQAQPQAQPEKMNMNQTRPEKVSMNQQTQPEKMNMNQNQPQAQPEKMNIDRQTQPEQTDMNPNQPER